MDPGTGVSSPASSQPNDDGAQADVAREKTMEEVAADDNHRHHLFKILKDAGMEIDDDLATAVKDAIARIKAEGAREEAAAIDKRSSASSGGILRRLIKGAASGIGYVMIHSACACAGIVLFLCIWAHLPSS